MQKIKPILCLFLCIILQSGGLISCQAKESNPVLDVSAKSAILIEAQTGQILYEKNADEMLRPASVTKIMTLLLIFEALEQGRLQLDEMVSVSAHAASMGGSQVFLEENETQTVQDLIKCISIASANDACVTMAERLCGTEEAFVQAMNEKAKSLGMEHTTFVNCCGLEAEGHLTSARDISIMSRELINAHPQIFDYCQIWQDEITHHTRRGESVFGLTNTNKFLKQYPYATGLKTGYTSLSKYCISATASKDDVGLIAVLMAEPDIPSRVKDIRALMDYGFSSCTRYVDKNPLPERQLPVNGGKERFVSISAEPFSYICKGSEAPDQIRQKITLPDALDAPVKANAKVGSVEYYLDGQLIGETPVLTCTTVKKRTYPDCFSRLLQTLCLS